MEAAENRLVSINGKVCDSVSEAARLLTKISGQKVYISELSQALDKGIDTIHGISIARVLERKPNLAERIYQEWLKSQTRAWPEQESSKKPLLRFPRD
jgi:hypothetical protein